MLTKGLAVKLVELTVGQHAISVAGQVTVSLKTSKKEVDVAATASA